jgi:Flp pilus assembly protein TadB
MQPLQPQPSDTGPAPASWNKPLAWISGILAAIGIVVTCVMSLGIAVIFWGPALVLFGVAMWGVWSARRQRQLYENRGPDETKDPQHAEHPWPTKGVIDDRLPQN